MRHIYLMFITVFSLFMVSCYEDKGNYDYKDVNEFEITSFNGSKKEFYTCTIDDNVSVVPELTFKRFTETDMIYEWFSDDSLISTEKELLIAAKDLKNVKKKLTRSYVKLKVTSKTTGNIQLRGINVDVTPIYFRGFIVLTQKSTGDHELNFLLNKWNVDLLPDVKVERNLYANQNFGETLGKNVVGLNVHHCFDYNYSEDVLVIRDEKPYTIDLLGSMMTKVAHTSNFFVGNKLPENYSPIYEFSFFAYSYIVNKDGRVFSRKKNSMKDFQSGVYLNEANRLHSPSSLPQDMEITRVFQSAPIYSSYAFLYDKKYRRILVASDDGRILYPFLLDSQKDFPAGFPLLHDLKGEILYIGRTSAKQHTDYTFVYKDDTGIIRLFKIFVTLSMSNGSTSRATLTNPRMYTSLDNSVLNAKTKFVQPNRSGDLLFFSGGADNNILYTYNFNTGATQPYVTFDEPITAMACEEYYSAESRSTDNRTMVVGFGSGTVKIVDIRYEAQHESNKENRLLHTIDLDNGSVKDIVCKVGFPYYAQ